MKLIFMTRARIILDHLKITLMAMGLISFIWDLTDGGGHTFESTNFTGVFTVTYDTSNVRPNVHKQGGSPVFQRLANNASNNGGTGGGAHPQDVHSATANQLWVKEPAWTPNNNWVVAYGLFNGQSGESSQNDIYMITGGPSGEYGGALGTLDQYGLIGGVSPGNSAINGTVFTVSDQTSRTNLLSYLASASPRYENFYFFGHGQCLSHRSYNGFILTKDQIAFALRNVPLSYPNPKRGYDVTTLPSMSPPTVSPDIQRVALHPYRFVFIDACDTAAGNFCEAFGVPAMTVSTNFFAASGVESRAFVGMKSWKLNLNVIGWMGYSEMTGGFLTDWLIGRDVQTCVNDARNNAYKSGAYMDSSVWIYGAYDMNHNTRTRP